MATPSNVVLTIVPDNFFASRVTVAYQANFTPAEVAGNLGSVATILLFGEDPPAGPAGDDLLLINFFPLPVFPNGLAVRQISRSALLPNILLDEDPGPNSDQIYVRVCLTRPLQVTNCDRSPTVVV